MYYTNCKHTGPDWLLKALRATTMKKIYKKPLADIYPYKVKKAPGASPEYLLGQSGPANTLRMLSLFVTKHGTELMR